jgi:hypothetical protein
VAIRILQPSSSAYRQAAIGLLSHRDQTFGGSPLTLGRPPFLLQPLLKEMVTRKRSSAIAWLDHDILSLSGTNAYCGCPEELRTLPLAADNANVAYGLSRHVPRS